MQLLEHFKELTIHPKNAKELKGLILQLAIQGKLTKRWRENNHNINSAKELLDEIKEYNESELKKSKRRVKKPSIENDLDLDLPQNWVKAYNYELFNLQKGKNPKDLSETEKKYEYLDIEALDRGNVRRYSDDEKAPKCKEGEILVVCDGSRSGLLLDAKFGILGSTLAIIHTPPFTKEFIKIIFLQDFERANANMKGAAIPHLDTKGLLSTPIGLPPLEEQKAIVEIVEQLFKEVEQLETQTKLRIQLKEDYVSSALRTLSTQPTEHAWASLMPHFKEFFTEKSAIKKLRETVLILAVQGKLTKKWRESRKLSGQDVEPASVLLEKIKAEKEQLIKDKKIKKEKPLPEITEKEIPYELPESWEWCKLGDIIKEKPRNGYSPQGVEFETKTKSLKLGAITRGFFNPNEVKYLNETIVRDSFLWLEPGDILIQRSNSIDYVGVSAIYNGQKHDFVYPDLMMKIKAVANISIDYLHQSLNSFYVRDYFRSKASGTSGNMPKINQGVVTNTILGIPPQAEQKVIVEKVNALMAICNQLEQAIEKSTEQVEQLMQSCLKEVFEK